MNRFRSINVFLGASLLTALVGCGSSNVATVHGVVTLDGAAVPMGAISFVPLGGGAQAYAMSDESGQYQVLTGREAGLKPGEYNVTVVARERPSTNQTESGGPAPPGKSITPRWYAAPDTSGLTFNVEAGSNNIDLQLTSSPPANWREPAKGQ